MTKRLVWMLGLGMSVLCGCAGPSSVPEGNNTVPALRIGSVSVDKNDYPVFPNTDEGADPQVSAENGGSGFAGEAWETNLSFALMGDPSAVKGGVIRSHQLDFPTTFRYRGPNTTEFDLMLDGLVYEGLLTLHPTSTEWIPALATHWQISPDRLTYRYRINPNARFSDGEPVTAEDVVATWELMMDPGLQDPAARLVYGKYDRPVAETPYIVSVTSTQLNWRNFLYFSSMPIYPAHVLNTIDGETYIRDYNYKMLPGTGPYIVNEADVDRGNRVIIRRRFDYWAENSLGVTSAYITLMRYIRSLSVTIISRSRCLNEEISITTTSMSPVNGLKNLIPSQCGAVYCRNGRCLTSIRWECPA